MLINKGVIVKNLSQCEKLSIIIHAVWFTFYAILLQKEYLSIIVEITFVVNVKYCIVLSLVAAELWGIFTKNFLWKNPRM